MIIGNLVGGLGNQMFQYACARALVLDLDLPLKFSTDGFGAYNAHNGFELGRVFGLKLDIAGGRELGRLIGWGRQSPTVRRVLGKRPFSWLAGRRFLGEPHFRYWPALCERARQGGYLHGYWQSERYFQEHADQIRADFVFQMDWDAQDDAVLQRMLEQSSASLHVRRGDYTHAKNQGVFAVCGLDYYRDAIRLLRQRVPGVRLFAFSDDPDWVDEHLGAEFGPIETVRHNAGARSARDMRLMAQADHHIIANSSFSWWGAWLNPSPDKVVVAPRRWFLNGTDDRDLIPASWIRI